jgi:hypothetical protein
MANKVMWFEVLGKDGNKVKKFYGELFGWQYFRVDRVHDLTDAVPDPARLAAIDPPVSLASYIRAMEQQSCAVPSAPAPANP